MLCGGPVAIATCLEQVTVRDSAFTHPCTTIYLGQGRKEQRPDGESEQEYTQCRRQFCLVCDIVVGADIRQGGGHHGGSQWCNKSVEGNLQRCSPSRCFCNGFNAESTHDADHDPLLALDPISWVDRVMHPVVLGILQGLFLSARMSNSSTTIKKTPEKRFMR